MLCTSLTIKSHLYIKFTYAFTYHQVLKKERVLTSDQILKYKQLLKCEQISKQSKSKIVGRFEDVIKLQELN